MCIIHPPFDPQSGTGKQPETQHLLARLKALEEENSVLTNRLLQSESRFRELLEGASDAVLEVSNDGKIQVANNAAVIMFGYALEELIGQEVEALLVPGAKREAHRHHREDYSQRPRIRRMGNGLELSAQKKDGTVFSVEISLIPVWSHEKATVIAIVQDISKRKRMEEKLYQAQKLEALGRLAGGTAHEFNNLLAVIMGSAELILTPEATEEQKRHVDRIRRASEKAGGLARQLLTFGRKQILFAQILDLNSLVAYLSPSFTELLGQAIEFQIVPAKAPVWIQADRLQIELVITNLLNNARSAMPRGGKVRLAVEAVVFTRDTGRANPGLPPGRYALLSIMDTGTGMTPDVKARMFEPFFSTKSLTEATGMGLATAYGIITQSGGTIAVRSEPDEGTTLDVFLPIPDEEAVAMSVSLPATSSQMRGNETILLLEDQPDLLMLTGEFLRLNGYRVLSASKAEEALRISASFQGMIDLLVTDIVMPGMDGREFAKKCRALRPGLPVLYVSGYTSDFLDDLGDGEAFIPKPFATEELGLTIRKMLSAGKTKVG